MVRELEVDDDNDFWADHDEDCHGTIDTDEMREEFPEGFFWNCCDKPGTAEGCTRGRHRAADDWRARLKADSPGSGSGSGSEGGEDEDGDEDE
ncbi:hypothetical protein SLS62_001473 [Diatrype stigma]|uniref:Uncharacterized protein n=1 Tax=Diatrype stigma TaxID=117547 RepID=A0AAN9YTM1_9PEZI